jgi:hypothetical protein
MTCSYNLFRKKLIYNHHRLRPPQCQILAPPLSGRKGGSGGTADAPDCRARLEHAEAEWSLSISVVST